MTTALEAHPIHSWLTDMDGVLVHEETPLPGAPEFIAALQRYGRPFLVLTNNSIFTPRDLRARGVDLDERAGDRAIPRRAAAGLGRLCDRRGGADQRDP
jgi:NagD protein